MAFGLHVIGSISRGVQSDEISQPKAAVVPSGSADPESLLSIAAAVVAHSVAGMIHVLSISTERDPEKIVKARKTDAELVSAATARARIFD
jgi:hypothetical protein